MKTNLSLAFLWLPIFCFGQINFEQVASPPDVSLRTIRKSPTGEYFSQPYLNQNVIYTSLDGNNWTETPLPEFNDLNEMQFFSDGTPILKGVERKHLIRRNGNWYTMSFGNGPVMSSFLKDDSLFVYRNGVFAISLDKGETFTTAFQANISFDYAVNLTKFDNYYVLSHSVGSTDSLSVFNHQGTKVFGASMNNFSSPDEYYILYNECGELLILDHFYDNYFLLKEDGLTLTQGDAGDIIPADIQYVYSHAGYYYIRQADVIYRSLGCGFDWQPFATDDLINSMDYYVVDASENIFLYNFLDDHFLELSAGANTFEEKFININHSFVVYVNELEPDQQVALTLNNVFLKNATEPNWNTITPSLPVQQSLLEQDIGIDLAPNGDLYLNTGTHFLHSTDNGISFNIIDYPDDGTFFPEFYSFKVIDDGLLVTVNFFGDSYYSLNNGQEWIQIDNTIYLPDLRAGMVKKVNNSLLIGELNSGSEVIEIDLATNQVTITDIGDFFSVGYIANVMLDDGTIYFYCDSDLQGPTIGLHRFKLGEGTTFLGPFPEVAQFQFIASSSGDLFAFDEYDNYYYRYNGISFTQFPLIDLPDYNYGDYFLLSKNQYLYKIVGNHEIYRSTQPLAEQQYISGSIFHDSNSDCQDDPTDATLQYWSVTVENDNYLNIKTTDSDGEYKFGVPLGEYSISAQPVDTNWDLCDSSFDLAITVPGSESFQDFKALPLTNCAALQLDFSTPLLRRCFDNYYTFRVRNTGPSISNATTLTIELDPFFDYLSASIPLTQLNDSILQVELGQLDVNEQVVFNIYFNLSCDAELSMEHCVSGSLADETMCPNSQSSYTECQENIGSYDPNDKRIFNAQGQETATVDIGEYIYYHIRFQNTGTDTAFTVRVEDALSPTLDLSTLEMLSASHTYSYSVNDGPMLAVLFENILLPDSTTNEVASHGFFKFRIKPLPANDYGTLIPNEAAIYFDFSNPVITNEAILEIQMLVGLSEKEWLEFTLSPNPTQDVISLSIATNDLSRITSFEITNQLGQVVFHQQNKGGALIFDVSHLESGLYYLVLKEQEKRIGARPFVRM